MKRPKNAIAPPVEFIVGTKTTPTENLRQLADDAKMQGRWEDGEALHALLDAYLDATGSIARADEAAAEASDLKENAKGAREEIDKAEAALDVLRKQVERYVADEHVDEFADLINDVREPIREARGFV